MGNKPSQKKGRVMKFGAIRLNAVNIKSRSVYSKRKSII